MRPESACLNKEFTMKKKYLFYITGFFSGLSVMAIELGASRLMAPYFSSSQIVWTIIIGTIMIAMALGNILGGKMADKSKNPDKLFLWIFAAATWTMLIPLLGKFVISGVAAVLTKQREDLSLSDVQRHILIGNYFSECFRYVL